jgi:hypothetical protein
MMNSKAKTECHPGRRILGQTRVGPAPMVIGSRGNRNQKSNSTSKVSVERAAKAVRREVRVQDSLPRTRELLEERAYELSTIERGVILSTNRIC